MSCSGLPALRLQAEGSRGSSSQQAPAAVDGWLVETSPTMTKEAGQVLDNSERFTFRGGGRRVTAEPAMTVERRNISSGSPYEPIVGFSRAVRIGNVVAVGGTAPIGPDGKTVGIGDPAAQVRRCFEITRAALEQAGARLEDVIRTRVLLTDIAHWEQVAQVHGGLFAGIRPASTIVQVTRFIDPEWLVETEVDAVVS